MASDGHSSIVDELDRFERLMSEGAYFSAAAALGGVIAHLEQNSVPLDDTRLRSGIDRLRSIAESVLCETDSVEAELEQMLDGGSHEFEELVLILTTVVSLDLVLCALHHTGATQAGKTSRSTGDVAELARGPRASQFRTAAQRVKRGWLIEISHPLLDP